MSSSKKVYKIKNLKTGEYISYQGYNSNKSSWFRFPSVAIRAMSYNNKSFMSEHIVDIFELVKISSLDTDGNELG